MDGKPRRYTMIPALGMVILPQNPSTRMGMFQAGVAFLAWILRDAFTVAGRGVSHWEIYTTSVLIYCLDIRTKYGQTHTEYGVEYSRVSLLTVYSVCIFRILCIRLLQFTEACTTHVFNFTSVFLSRSVLSPQLTQWF